MKKFVIALIVSAAPAMVFAQTAGNGGFHHGAHHHDFAKMAAKLNLSDAQKQQMKDIRTADRANNKQLYADFHAKLQQFQALKEANDPKAADVKAELEAMKPQIKAARKASRQAMLNVLTPEQRAELKSSKDSKEGHGFGRGHGAAFQALNLTAEQKAAIKQASKNIHAENKDLFATVKAKKQELHALKQAGDPKAADVKAELEALRPQMKAVRQKEHEAFRSVLTPEQQSQLEQWKAERQSSRRNGR
jgi:Spy/CpxP family protein refolding chaperone